MKDNIYKIVLILNHNAIMCESLDKSEKRILFDKGIGFQKRVGDQFLYEDSVDRDLLILEGNLINQYEKLINDVTEPHLVSVVQEIVESAKAFFEYKISPSLHITLLDHLNFALERKRQGIIMTYPFINELQIIYPKEYEFSKKALETINKSISSDFPQSELGFIILHIHAAITEKSVSKVLLQNQIFYEIKEIIEECLNITIDLSSRYYLRFINHVEFAIHRTDKKISITNDLVESIQERAPVEYECAVEVAEHLEDKYHIELSEDEIGYMTLHVHSLINK